MTKSKKKPLAYKRKPIQPKLIVASASKTPSELFPNQNAPKPSSITQMQQKLPFTAATPRTNLAVNAIADITPPNSDTPIDITNKAPEDSMPIDVNANRNHASLQPTTVSAGNAEPLDISRRHETYPTNASRQTLRYKVTIEAKKPDDQTEQLTPSEQFALNFRQVFKRMQAIVGTNLRIATWDPEQEQTFPDLLNPDTTPKGTTFDDKQMLNIYTNAYVSSKKENSRIWTQLRLAHEKPLKIELSKVGEALQNAFEDFKFDVRFSRQPNHCQATHVECIGWLYGSTKTISEETFIPAIRSALNLSDKVAFGIQWRVITDKYGKRPPYDQENPPPSAIHLDIDKRFATLIQKQASNLWKKYNKNKERPAVPNDIQLRLVPCFSSKYSEARKTPTTEENVILMAGKQHYFTTHCIERVDVPFIRFLDSPLSPTNPITLRKAMMARAPPEDPTKRLIHNVDAQWNDRRQVQVTTIKSLLHHTHEFISTLIPEMVYKYGQECQKWFTADGISYFDTVVWDPKKMSTTSSADKDTQELVDEDLWGLGDDWRASSQKLSPPKVGASILKNKLTQKINKDRVTTAPLENDDDIKSFASAFGMENSESSPPGEDTGQTKVGSMVKLSSEVLQSLNEKKGNNDRDTCSMSTAARTTESTRLKLQDARCKIDEQELEIERLRRMIAANPVHPPTGRLKPRTPMRTNPRPANPVDPTEAANTSLPPSSVSSQGTADIGSSDSEANSPIDDQASTASNSEPTPSNLRSKFSAAKSSAAARKAKGRSPPNKVRYSRTIDICDSPKNETTRTQFSFSPDSGDSSSSHTDDSIPEPVNFRAHHPTIDRAPTVIDMVDDGSRA